MDDGYQPVLQSRGVADKRAQIQVLGERHRRTVFAPGTVDSGEALEFENEDFGCGGEAGELYVVCCPLVTRGAMSGGIDVVKVSVSAVADETI